MIIYNHGSDKGEACLNHCNKGSMNVPEVIRNLHNKKINDLTIKIYRMCAGVRGLKEYDWVRVHDLWRQEENVNGFIEMSDFDGIKMYDKLKQMSKKKITLDKVNELIEKGFTNIVLTGHSCGAMVSLHLTSSYSDKVKGSIAINPACGGTIKYRKEWPAWGALRDHWANILAQKLEINSLVFIHNEDQYENIQTLSFLTKINKVQIVDFTDINCEPAYGANHHELAVYPKEDNCFAKWEAKNKYIINYLKGLF